MSSWGLILESNHRRPLIWLLVGCLALALHLGFFWMAQNWTWSPPQARSPVELVDPAKLDAIRQKWKERLENDSQGLLLNPKGEVTEEPSDQARYESDRNVRVEKEQRARQSDVLPKAGTPGAQNRSKEPDRKSLPQDLARLGVPLYSSPTQKNSAGESGTEGMDQSVVDRSLPEGTSNLLNTKETVYYSFYARIYEAIAPIWKRRLNSTGPLRSLSAGDYVTQVEVVLDETGAVRDIKIMDSSYVPEFDEAAVQAWKQIDRFPNPPAGLLNEQREVHMGWSFVVHVGGGFFKVAPPTHVY